MCRNPQLFLQTSFGNLTHNQMMWLVMIVLLHRADVETRLHQMIIWSYGRAASTIITLTYSSLSDLHIGDDGVRRTVVIAWLSSDRLKLPINYVIPLDVFYYHCQFCQFSACPANFRRDIDTNHNCPTTRWLCRIIFGLKVTVIGGGGDAMKGKIELHLKEKL